MIVLPVSRIAYCNMHENTIILLISVKYISYNQNNPYYEWLKQLIKLGYVLQIDAPKDSYFHSLFATESWINDKFNFTSLCLRL